jgi:hypothetical protein
MRSKFRVERILVVAALGLIAADWVLGGIRAGADLMPSVREAMPEAGHIVRQDDGLYTAWADDTETELLGHQSRFPFTRQVRWATMIGGDVIEVITN